MTAHTASSKERLYAAIDPVSYTHLANCAILAVTDSDLKTVSFVEVIST